MQKSHFFHIFRVSVIEQPKVVRELEINYLRRHRMGKDLNGKELGSGIYQRKDRIYVANVRCGGRTKSLYDTDPDNLKKRQAIIAKTKSGKEK